MKRIFKSHLFISIIFLFCLFFVSTKTVLADCSYPCGFLGLGTCYVPVNNYHCGWLTNDLDRDGVKISSYYIYKCTSTGWDNVTHCPNENQGAYGCVNDGNNAYCACGFGEWDPVIPIGYSRSYSTSSRDFSSSGVAVCVSNGYWIDEDTNPVCENNGYGNAWSRDCDYLEPQEDCVWSSSQNECVLEVVPEPCICTNNSSYCWTHADSCGAWVCPGTKPDINGGWSAWTACDPDVGACGTGTQSRTCTNPTPQCDGLYCSGSSTQSCTVGCPVGQSCLSNICRSPVNGACSSPLNRYVCNGLIGMDIGAEACLDRGGTCQTNGGVMPAVGSACTLNTGVAGNIQSGYCGGQYDAAYRCCVPNNPLPAGDSAWLCRGVYNGSNASCACPAEVSCPTTCHTTTVYVSNGDCGTKSCPSNAPAAGTCPICRTAASTVPNGSCGTTNCPINCNTTCFGTVCDSPPTFSSFVLRNINNTDVADEAGNNHICQSVFTGTASPTTARFVATYTDLQGGIDISNIQLTLGSQTFNPTSLTRSGNNATAIFDITTAQISSTTLQSIIFSASDVDAYTGSVVSSDTGRDFKYWDCNVPISGTAYDGSSTDSSCSDSSFNSPISIPYTLSMVNVSGGASQNMVVNSPDYSGSLVWGDSYIFNPTMGGNNFKLRFNSNIATCTNSLQFIIDSAKVNPYNPTIQFDTDFTSVLNQDPWWQTTNGGAVSNTSVNDRVPVTCSTCKISPSGLVSAPGVNNTGRSLESIQAWYYQSANAKLAVNNTNYSYFLSQYHDKNSVGTVLDGKTINSINDLGSDANNIFFVNGNLTINGNIIKTGNFLMIIVNGNVSVTGNATQVDGILIANNITATGTAPRLTFNGSLYAVGDINFSTRDLGGSANNLNPAVVVNHDPKMIFYLPGSLTKVLTNWQWGN